MNIIILPAVVIIEREGIISEPNFRIVLFQLRHFQKYGIISQLCYKKLDLFAIVFGF
jgi:hypothetical protein